MNTATERKHLTAALTLAADLLEIAKASAEDANAALAELEAAQAAESEENFLRTHTIHQSGQEILTIHERTSPEDAYFVRHTVVFASRLLENDKGTVEPETLANIAQAWADGADWIERRRKRFTAEGMANPGICEGPGISPRQKSLWGLKGRIAAFCLTCEHHLPEKGQPPRTLTEARYQGRFEALEEVLKMLEEEIRK